MVPDPTESDELITRASRGEAAAVDTLLERYLPGLRQMVQHRMGEAIRARESGSDIVQSCCREVLHHLDRYQYDGEEGFRNWLYTMAIRKIKNRHRFYQALKRSPGSDEAVRDSLVDPARQSFVKSSETPSREAIKNEELAHVQQLLNDLPEMYRKIISMVYLDQLSHSEIALRLGITPSHARVKLTRAMARLARMARARETRGRGESPNDPPGVNRP